MKYVFLCIFIFLLGASFFTWKSLPSTQTDHPVIYWVTDTNPARLDQVNLFHRWLVDNGHSQTIVLQTREEAREFVAKPRSDGMRRAIRLCNEQGRALLEDKLADGDFPLTIRLPVCELRLDTANADNTKKIVQSVSGVGGDIMDTYALHLFHAIGIASDMTDYAKQYNYGPDQTYPAIVPDLTIRNDQGELRQYTFPCNVTSNMYFVNRETFRKFNQPVPTGAWSVQEFERAGKAFVSAANPPGKRPVYFFADTVDFPVLRRSFGLSEFNETLTRCTLDHPDHVEALKLYYKWIEVDRILPNASDRASFSTDAGYGGSTPQLFNSGNYAMLYTGRYLLIQFRKFDEARIARGEKPLDLGTAEPPYRHKPYHNVNIGARAACVYTGSKHQKYAALFQAFLASESYNLLIVRDADALPPNPKYTELEAYNRPPDRPTEWDIHQPFAEIAKTIAIANPNSPFVLRSEVDREDNDARDRFLNNLLTADQAARQVAERVNQLIDRNVSENADLKRQFDARWKIQKQIDQYKAEGWKIPRAWIDNPFHLKHYEREGLLE